MVELHACHNKYSNQTKEIIALAGNNTKNTTSEGIDTENVACYHSVISRLSHKYSAGKKGGAILIQPVSAASESIDRKRITLKKRSRNANRQHGY